MNDSIIRLRNLTVVIKQECELAISEGPMKGRRFARKAVIFMNAIQHSIASWARGDDIVELLKTVIDTDDLFDDATTENAVLAIRISMATELIKEIIAE